MFNETKMIIVLMMTNAIISISPFKNLKPNYHNHKDHAKTNEKAMNQSKLKAHHKGGTVSNELIAKINSVCGDDCNAIKLKKLLNADEYDEQKVDKDKVENYLKEIKKHIFDLLNIDNDNNLSPLEFLALRKHEKQTDYREYVTQFSVCDKDNNQELTLLEFQDEDYCYFSRNFEFENKNSKVYEQILAILIEIADNNLDVSNSDGILQPKELIKLFTSSDILTIGFNRTKSNEEMTDTTFYKFIELASIQNLQFAKFDQHQNVDVMKSQGGAISQEILSDKFKRPCTNCSEESITIEGFRLALKADKNSHQGDNVKLLWGKHEKQSLTKEEIKTFLTGK